MAILQILDSTGKDKPEKLFFETTLEAVRAADQLVKEQPHKDYIVLDQHLEKCYGR